jgi:hypothetical protein
MDGQPSYSQLTLRTPTGLRYPMSNDIGWNLQLASLGFRTPKGPFFGGFFIDIIAGLVAEFAFGAIDTADDVSFCFCRKLHGT